MEGNGEEGIVKLTAFFKLSASNVAANETVAAVDESAVERGETTMSPAFVELWAAIASQVPFYRVLAEGGGGFWLDKVLEEQGHAVLRPPPQLLDLNPMENVWCVPSASVGATDPSSNRMDPFSDVLARITPFAGI